jgi:predicted  nucleic acid-binding Zn-ribbon protein
MSWLETLKQAELVLGFVLALVSSGAAAILWGNRRIKAISRSVTAAAVEPLGENTRRLDDVEGEVEQVMQRVTELRADVGGLTDRIQGVEALMQTVAQQRDLAALSQDLGELRGAITAEMRMVSGQMHTLYEAALRASQQK